MRKLIFILLAVSLNVSGAKYFIAPTASGGNDGNAGTMASPWYTLQKACTGRIAGDTVYLRGGTYYYTYGMQIANITGTAYSPIRIMSYQEEVPIFNFINRTWSTGGMGVSTNATCAYLYFKGITLCNMAQTADTLNPHHGFRLFGNNFTLERCVAHHIDGYGFEAIGSNFLFLNCDAHHCGDPLSGYENGNGFNYVWQTGTTNVRFEGCRAWNCGDDGFDTFNANGYCSFYNCWSFRNGYSDSWQHLGPSAMVGGDGNGFKLGPPSDGIVNVIRRKATNCIAFDNWGDGFDQNNSYTMSHLCEIYNNTSFRNKGRVPPDVTEHPSTGYFFFNVPHIVRNNIAYLNYRDQYVNTGVVQSNNTWNSIPVTSTDFLSLDTTGVTGPRQADGSLPVLNFLKLSPTSTLINKGYYVGIPYSGTAPDLGAYEYIEAPPVTTIKYLKYNGKMIKHNGKYIIY